MAIDQWSVSSFIPLYLLSSACISVVSFYFFLFFVEYTGTAVTNGLAGLTPRAGEATAFVTFDVDNKIVPSRGLSINEGDELLITNDGEGGWAGLTHENQ